MRIRRGSRNISRRTPHKLVMGAAGCAAAPAMPHCPQLVIIQRGHMPNDAQPSTSGSSNKMWYIIGGIVLLIILVWFAAKGAGFFALRAAGVDVTPSANRSGTYTGNEGSVNVGPTMPS